MELLRQILDRFEIRRAQSLLENIHAWHQTSTQLCQHLGTALLDENIATSDIGVVLDKADRQLFSLRIYSADAQASLKRYYPLLARRLSGITENIFRLRNETAQFLIHSQGPGTVLVGLQLEGDISRHYYYKALQDYGFKARDLHQSIDSDIQKLWHEMQLAIANAEKIVKSSS